MTMFRQHSARVFAVLAIFIAATVGSIAQLPRQISYQGYLGQAGGAPIADGQYTIVLRLYDSQTGGNLLWEESQQTTIARGLFNVYLGTVQTLDNVDFSKPMYLETALAGQPAFARTMLTQVPYAIYAGRAGSAASLDSAATGFVRSLNGGEGNLVIKGQDGIVVNRNNDTIVIQSTITFTAIQSVTSPEGTINVVGQSGPNTTVDVKDGAISTVKLADNAVTSAKISDGSINAVDISNGAVTASKIAPGVIPTTLPPSGPAGGDLTGLYPNPLLANGSVTGVKIADNSVTTPKLTDGVVTTPKISDGAVTSAKLSTTGVTAGTYGDVVNIPRITVDAQGRVTGVTNTSIANFPYIVPAGGDLTGTYPDPIIRNNAITTAKLLDASVTTAKIVDQSVTNVKIADNAVNSAKIQDFTIVNQDIAPGVIPSQLPPIGPAGGDLAGLYPNPSIATWAVTPTKVTPMLGGRFVIGTGTSSSAAVGTIVAGTGLNVQYNNPNITISASSNVIAGTANDQTIRWDAASNSWQPNANVLASSAGAMQVGGALTLLSSTTDYQGSVVDLANRTRTFLAFGEAGSNNDWAYLRQIGNGSNDYHLALDFHDDGNDGKFSIRTIGSSLGTPDPAPVTRLALDADGRFMIGASSATTPFYFAASGSVDGVENASNTDAASLYIHNTNNASTSAHAVGLIRAGGSNGGNAFTSWDIANESGYSMGVDNADNNKLKIMGVWDFITNVPSNVLMAFDRTVPSIEINTSTVRMPSLPTGSTGSNFVVSNGGALQTRTINNITTGTGTVGRMTRWGANNTLVDASLDDNGNGQYTRTNGSIRLASVGSIVNIDDGLVVDGRDVFIGDAFGGSLSIREPGGNFNARITSDNLGNATRNYIIPSSNVATTYFLLRDFNGTQTITNGLGVNGRFRVGASVSPTPMYFAANGSIDAGETLDNNDAATLYVHNTNNASTTAHAVSLIRAAGSGGGNAFTSWDVVSDNGYSMGIDNADSKLKISRTWNFDVNTPGNVLMEFDYAVPSVEIKTATVTMPNLPTGSTSSNFVVSNNGSLQTRTINNVITGTGTLDRLTRWTSANTLGTSSFTDDGNGLAVMNGSLALSAGTTNYYDGIVDLANRTNTYLTFDHAGSNNDWAYLRQIGGSDDIHLSMDYHDNGGGKFSIRTISSFPGVPDPAPLTRFTVQDDRVGINTAAPQATIHAYTPGTTGVNSEEIMRLETNAGQYRFYVADDFNNATYGSGAADYGANNPLPALVMNLPGDGQFVFGDDVGPWSDNTYDLGETYARWRNLYLSGNVLNVSDYRLKTDLRSFDALSLVNKIPVYDYKWKADGKRVYGFMAHELQAVLPYLVEGAKDAVNERGEPVYQMMDYSKITPILTKAIQEQQTLIDKQQATINDQQERLEKLEALVKQLIDGK